MKLSCSLVLLVIVCSVKCAKILGIFPSPGYSQFILAEKLMTELAARGHEVTVICPFQPKEVVQNYRPILIDGMPNVPTGELYEEENSDIFTSIIFLEGFGQMLTEHVLAHEKVQNLIHSNETFDVVIVEKFVNDAHMGFATHFKAPLIIFSSIGLCEWTSHLVGNVRPPSVNPLLSTPYTDRMSFFQRLNNAIYSWFEVIHRELVSLPGQQRLLHKYFPEKMNLKEIIYNASIILMNTHASIYYPSTLTTSIIQIGGFHVSSKKLPSNIESFLNEASEGAILLSMGSNLRSADLPKEKLNGILNALAKLKQKVLWKFEDTNIFNKPNNVLISKWLPQSDILAHPNIVAFITHGGFLSTTESIHFGVPMIGIPVFGDQKLNVAKSVEKQIAVHLPFKKLSEESLSTALNEILNNPKYRRNAKEYSTTLRDQIVKPMDLAMFWVEYVIRHGGAPHFRNASMDLYWFQLYLVDVICFIVLCIVIICFLIRLLIRKIFVQQNKSHIRKNNDKQKTN